MDALETARQDARRLHDEVVDGGGSPVDPYAFAVDAAALLDIDVESAQPGATVLDGAGATYLPDDKLIVVETSGSRFDRAFRVAHEIGHAVRGDGSTITAAGDADLVLPLSSTTPVSEKVPDYGRWQRLEIRLDLFARELLLPRALLRALYVTDGVSAAAIASRFDAPFTLVAQQLLDALLLPEGPEGTADEASAETLVPDDEQAAAAAHPGRLFLLLAGPGTGKTQTLTARVSRLLERGVDPKRMLLLTFSNRAAAEMSGRIAARRPQAAAALWAGTFNAFGLDLLRRFHVALEIPHNARLLERSEAIELLEREILGLDLKHHRNLANPVNEINSILDAISRAKDELASPARYLELANEMIDSAVTEEARTAGERAVEVARVYTLYERLKDEEGCIDFGDQIMLPAKLLERSAEIRAHLQDQYDHVLVDEYQDVNRASVRLLSALVGDRTHLWAVGDARQSIYRFRGASAFNVERFGTRDFAGGDTGRLTMNYRSTSEIVTTCNAFAEEISGVRSETGELRSHGSATGHGPALRLTRTASELNAALSEAIEEMRRAGYTYRDQAILCAGNHTLGTVAGDLERSDVPTLFLGSVFERPEVRDVLALLSMVTDRRGAGLLRAAQLPTSRCRCRTSRRYWTMSGSPGIAARGATYR